MNQPAQYRSRKREVAKLSFILALGLLSPRCVRSIPPAFEIYQPPRLIGDPPSIPLVRLETGMHTNLITQIATDAGGRWLATSSYDKTARVWDLANGNLLRVLRPPQGDGWEGVLYAVALTPDGERVAVAGAKGSHQKEGGSVYIFDRASGKLVRRIPGSATDVIRLAFSPNGRALAVAARDCLRLIDPSSGAEFAKDAFRRVDTYGVHFRYDGKRLVTASLDGTLRLYDVEGAVLRKLVEARAPVGDQPYAARFSPDGTRIA